MLWQGRRESDNVEDERGSRGGGRRLVLGGGIGTVILVVLYLLLGGDPQALFNSQQAQLPQTAQYDNQSPRDDASKFVAVVLAETEDAWNQIFRQMGREYEEPKGRSHKHRPHPRVAPSASSAHVRIRPTGIGLRASRRPRIRAFERCLWPARTMLVAGTNDARGPYR